MCFAEAVNIAVETDETGQSPGRDGTRPGNKVKVLKPYADGKYQQKNAKNLVPRRTVTVLALRQKLSSAHELMLQK